MHVRRREEKRGGDEHEQEQGSEGRALEQPHLVTCSDADLSHPAIITVLPHNPRCTPQLLSLWMKYRLELSKSLKRPWTD